MIRPRYIPSFVIALTLSGCVILPVNRTYFEPNAADGKPIPSASCGYHQTAKDGISGYIGGAEIQIFPTFTDDQPLRIHLRIPRSSPRAELSPDRIVLKINAQSAEIHPSDATRTNPGPYFHSVIDLVFPIELTRSVIFPLNSFEVQS